MAGNGSLIHGFDRTAWMTMMPYHHAYYRDLLEGAEMTQVAADNELLMANVERIDVDILKTHRVFTRAL